MWTVVLIALGVVVATVLFIASNKPDTWVLHRSRMIKAPESRIFPLIADFHQWTRWSPWENVEGDALQRKYSGAESGVGAIYEWEGKKTGAGRMEIVETIAEAEVKIMLDFLKPMVARNTTTFAMMEEPEGTLVNWTMTSPQTYMFKLMGMFMRPEKMLGPTFDKGLASIAAIAETP